MTSPAGSQGGSGEVSQSGCHGLPGSSMEGKHLWDILYSYSTAIRMLRVIPEASGYS